MVMQEIGKPVKVWCPVCEDWVSVDLQTFAENKITLKSKCGHVLL